jgi:hypothetical protein
MFETSGISQQTATAKKESGITSGVAIQAIGDLQSDRLSIASIGYEGFFVDSAKRAIEQMKQIYQDDQSYTVSVPHKNKLITLDWDDVNIQEDAYIMQAQAISSMPRLYPGKLNYVNVLHQMRSYSPLPSHPSSF